MAVINENALKAQIKEANYSNAYFIYGEESFLKEHYIKLLKKKIVNPTFEDFNLHIYENKNVALANILKDAMTLPMMSDYNLIIAYDYPFDLKSEIEDIKEYLKDVPPSTILIFVYEAINVDVKKEAKWKTLTKAFAKYGDVVELQKRSESDVVKIISSICTKRGASITTDNARYLISVTGNDIKTVTNETEKIAMFCKDKEVTKDVIDNMATKCLQARIFDLSKNILKGDAQSSFSILNSLFELREEPISILAVISSCYVDMYRVKCAKIAGKGAEDVANYYAYKGREFVLRNALRDSSKISIPMLRKSIDIISDTDVKLKSTSTDKKILLEELLVKLIYVAGGSL